MQINNLTGRWTPRAEQPPSTGPAWRGCQNQHVTGKGRDLHSHGPRLNKHIRVFPILAPDEQTSTTKTFESVGKGTPMLVSCAVHKGCCLRGWGNHRSEPGLVCTPRLLRMNSYVQYPMATPGMTCAHACIHHGHPSHACPTSSCQSQCRALPLLHRLLPSGLMSEHKDSTISKKNS
jgi:hypothetical protein